jgi:methyl-accepting chemotaxis protein
MGLFYNLRTLWKLLLGFGVVCGIMSFIGWLGVTKTATISGLLSSLYERELVGVSEAKEANINILYVSRASRTALLETDPKIIQGIQHEIAGHFEEFDKRMRTVAQTVDGDDGHQILTRIQSTIPEYQTDINRCIELCVAGDSTGAKTALEATRDKAEQIDADITALAKMKVAQAKTAYESSDAIYLSSRNMILGFAIGGVALGMLIGYYIARIIAQPLIQAVNVLQRVAQGDFTARLNLKTKDEVGQLGQALNDALSAIQTTLVEARVVADNVATAAQQLSSASEEISSGAQEQASGLEETASSLEEITSTVKQNADNAQQASQLAVSAKEVAEKGGRIVSDAVQGMSEINSSSRRIADIITTIDEIAFQTNLLALNAAVEAARAGEQGRGFAVVAGEVRNLAQRSAGAAREIKVLIQDSVQKVASGSDLVNQSGEALEQIVTSVKRVTDIVSEIAAASREQTRGIEQVNTAVTQMDTVTQSNASQTEELSSTAESLAGQAEQLQGLVSKFKLEEAVQRQSPATTDKPFKQSGKTNRNATSPKPLPAETLTSQKSSFNFDDEAEGQLVGAGAGSGKNSYDGFEEF